MAASMTPSVLKGVGTRMGDPRGPWCLTWDMSLGKTCAGEPCSELPPRPGWGGPVTSRGRRAHVGQWLGVEQATPFNSHWWDGCGWNPQSFKWKVLQNRSPEPMLTEQPLSATHTSRTRRQCATPNVLQTAEGTWAALLPGRGQATTLPPASAALL